MTGRVQVDGSGDLTPLDESVATAPALKNTWFVALVRSLVQKVTGKTSAAATDGDETLDDESELDSGVSTPNSEGSAATGSGPRKTRASATTKAGGARRKAVKRR